MLNLKEEHAFIHFFIFLRIKKVLNFNHFIYL